MPSAPHDQWEVIDDELEISPREATKIEVPFRLLAFPIKVDNFEVTIHFPNHWHRYEPWPELQSPVRTTPGSSVSPSHITL
jgi:hypothetical protein